MSHSQQLARGMFWLGSATLASRVIDVVTSIVVLRVLSGTQLGVATVALTVVLFLEGFNSLGISNVIIQRAELSADQIASVWWYVLGVAVVLMGGLMLLAPLVAGLYGAPELTSLLRFVAFKLLFVGLASVPLALLNRDLRFREIGAIMTVATLLASLVTIALAATGAGAMAPLAGSTAHGLFQFLGTCVVAFYRPRARFRWADVADMARDGVQLAGAVSIGQLTRNVDYLVLGKAVGLNMLGTYRVAFDLAMAPSLVALQIVNRASLPIYSRIIGAGGDLSPAFARTARLIALLLLPALVLAAFDGDVLFDLLDKAHAGDIALVIAGLCVAAWLRGLSQCAPIVLIASGRPTRALLQAVSSATLLTAALILGLQLWPDRDPLIVAACAWIASMGAQLAVDYALAGSGLALTARDWFKAVAVPAGVGLSTAGAVLAVRTLIPIEAPVARLAVDAATILIVFAAILRYGLKIRGLQELRPKPSPAAESAP